MDGLRQAHLGFLRVAKVFDSESYDYPVQLQESVSELSGTIAHSLSYWAAAATKGEWKDNFSRREERVEGNDGGRS